MSRRIMRKILEEMKLRLTEKEEDELHKELIRHFGLIGGTNECTALENAWMDPYVKNRIKEFIEAWLKHRQKKEQQVYIA